MYRWKLERPFDDVHRLSSFLITELGRISRAPAFGSHASSSEIFARGPHGILSRASPFRTARSPKPTLPPGTRSTISEAQADGYRSPGRLKTSVHDLAGTNG